MSMNHWLAVGSLALCTSAFAQSSDLDRRKEVRVFASNSCIDFEETRRLHELMGGFRFSAPNPTRFTPYGVVSAGALTLTDRTESRDPLSGDTSDSTSGTHFAIAVGGGLNFTISPHFGLTVEARARQPSPPLLWLLWPNPPTFLSFRGKGNVSPGESWPSFSLPYF